MCATLKVDQMLPLFQTHLSEPVLYLTFCGVLTMNLLYDYFYFRFVLQMKYVVLRERF